MNCLQGFTQESSRDQHQVYCEDNESVRVEMPKQSSTVEFKDGQNQFKVPFIMYADFKSILELMDPVEPGSPNQSQPAHFKTCHLVGVFTASLLPEMLIIC